MDRRQADMNAMLWAIHYESKDGEALVHQKSGELKINCPICNKSVQKERS